MRNPSDFPPNLTAYSNFEYRPTQWSPQFRWTEHQHQSVAANASFIHYQHLSSPHIRGSLPTTPPAPLTTGKEDEKKNAPEWGHFENPGTAFLGPQLWEKPVACETELKLEYMDLDEFLNEKNIDDELLKRTLAELPHSLPQPLPQEEKSPDTPTDIAHLVSTLASENSLQTPSPGSSKTGCSSPVSRLALDYANSSPKSDPKSPLSPSSSLSDYKEDFDPRSHPFSEDDLKLQPMSKKSQKRYVPYEMKDDRYWARRRKNNMAAKRSRDARRMKENQIALRAIFLEKENNNLRNELDKTRAILEMMKKRLDAYEPPQ